MCSSDLLAHVRAKTTFLNLLQSKLPSPLVACSTEILSFSLRGLRIPMADPLWAMTI